MRVTAANRFLLQVGQEVEAARREAEMPARLGDPQHAGRIRNDLQVDKSRLFGDIAVDRT